MPAIQNPAPLVKAAAVANIHTATQIKLKGFGTTLVALHVSCPTKHVCLVRETLYVKATHELVRDVSTAHVSATGKVTFSKPTILSARPA